MTEIDAEIEALASRAVDGLEDVGEARLKRAHVRRSFAEAILRQVAARHAVMVTAILRKHQSRQLNHVVMARAQACHLLYAAGYSYPEIAKLLGMSHHSQAMRSRQLWTDHLAGKLVTVSEADGRRALAIMRRFDLSVAKAAERMGLSPVKLKARISTIKAKDKREKADVAAQQ